MTQKLVQVQASFVNSLRPCPNEYREEVFDWVMEQAKTWIITAEEEAAAGSTRRDPIIERRPVLEQLATHLRWSHFDFQII
jgi:hypothetical protein